MRICLFSKSKTSSNLLYSGVISALKELKIPFIDINISLERKETPPRWLSIPTLQPKIPPPFDKLILKKIEQFKPNLLFLLQHSGLQFILDNSHFFKKILGKDGKIAFWLVDLAEKIFENKSIGKLIDFFFITNAGQIKEYQKKWGVKNIFFMPQGCFVAKKFPSLKKRVYSLGFLGRRQRNDKRYQERNRILDTFKEKLSLIESESELNLTKQINFYQKCKIIIGSSWRNDVYLYSSDRIFNVLGAGSFYLCSYFPGIEKLFENKKHLVWFKDINEGLNLAKYYLKNDKERERIAYNGYILMKKKHTYFHRMKNIIEIINGKTNKFLGYL